MNVRRQTIRRRRLCALGLVVAIGAPWPVAAVRPQRGASAPSGATVSGVVIDAEAGRPAAETIVKLEGYASRAVLTGADGRFTFNDVDPGQFRLTARKFGRAGAFGQRNPKDVPSVLTVTPGGGVAGSGLALDRLSITLWPSMTISGTVTDDLNRPLADTTVRAIRYAAVCGVADDSGPPPVKTDDRGTYAITLPASGSYVVVVPIGHNTIDVNPGLIARDAGMWILRGPTDAAGLHTLDNATTPRASSRQDGRPRTFATTFAPGVTTADQSRVIRVQTGDDITGVDVRLTPVRAITITGHVVDGPPSESALLSLFRDETSRRLGLPDAQSTTDDRLFTMLSVPEGVYTLDASVTPSNARPQVPTAEARQIISAADHDLDDVVVGLHQTASVSGRVEFEGGAPAGTVSVILSPANGRGLTVVGTTAPDTFVIQSIPAGRYVVTVHPLSVRAPSALRSVMVDGRVSADGTIEVGDEDVHDVVIGLTTRIATLSGHVAADATQHWSVLLLPSAPGEMQARLARTHDVGAAGGYLFVDVLPGDYLVTVLRDSDLEDWFVPAKLRAIVAAATRVSIADGEQKTVDLRGQR